MATSRSRSTPSSPTTPREQSRKHFQEAIARPNLLVKIPATDAGVPAIEEMSARGYADSVTSYFVSLVDSETDRRLAETGREDL